MVENSVGMNSRLDLIDSLKRKRLCYPKSASTLRAPNIGLPPLLPRYGNISVVHKEKHGHYFPSTCKPVPSSLAHPA